MPPEAIKDMSSRENGKSKSKVLYIGNIFIIYIIIYIFIYIYLYPIYFYPIYFTQTGNGLVSD